MDRESHFDPLDPAARNMGGRTSNPLSARQLTRTAGNLTGSPRWSPDGTRIACDARPDGQPDIFVVDAATGQMTRITTESSEDVVPSWSNDGKWIYFASNRTGSMQVWKSPSAGGAARQVNDRVGLRHGSPGREISLLRERANASGSLARTGRGRDGGAGFGRLKPGYWGYWSICDGNLYLMDKKSPKTPTALFKYELSTHKLTRLRDMMSTARSRRFGLSHVSRFGSILYSQRDEGGSDIITWNSQASESAVLLRFRAYFNVKALRTKTPYRDESGSAFHTYKLVGVALRSCCDLS